MIFSFFCFVVLQSVKVGAVDAKLFLSDVVEEDGVEGYGLGLGPAEMVNFLLLSSPQKNKITKTKNKNSNPELCISLSIIYTNSPKQNNNTNNSEHLPTSDGTSKTSNCAKRRAQDQFRPKTTKAQHKREDSDQTKQHLLQTLVA